MSKPESAPSTFPMEVPYYGNIYPDTDDFVVRYWTAPHYDHIRYHEAVPIRTDAGEIKYLTRIRALFVGAKVLDLLSGLGVPEAFADKPSDSVEATYQADFMARLERELGMTEQTDDQQDNEADS